MVTNHRERSAVAASAAAEIVLKVPAKLKALVAPIEKLLEFVLNRTDLLERDGRAVDYAAIESSCIEHLAGLERASHQCMLEAAARDAERVLIRGEEYVCVAVGNGTYYGMAGPNEVRRNLYRKVGERHGKVVDAISLRIGVVGDGWLPHAAKAMAHLHQQGHSREAEQTARQVGRLPYSRASFERVPHLVGGLWIEHHADIEDCLIQEQEIPKEAKSISVSLDRTSAAGATAQGRAEGGAELPHGLLRHGHAARQGRRCPVHAALRPDAALRPAGAVQQHGKRRPAVARSEAGPAHVPPGRWCGGHVEPAGGELPRERVRPTVGAQVISASGPREQALANQPKATAA